MKKMLLIGLISLLSCGSTAWGQGRMINISASGVVDGDPVIAQIACTIVLGDNVPIIILAEAVTSANPETDPLLGLFSLGDNELVPVQDNDNWIDLPLDERQLIENFLRKPNRPTDSAVTVLASNIAICAYAFEAAENGPQGEINLQINDIADVFNARAANSFSRRSIGAEGAAFDFDLESAARSKVAELLEEYQRARSD